MQLLGGWNAVLPAWLWALALVWAALLLGGFWFGTPQADGRRMPAWTRLDSSLILVIAAGSSALMAGTDGPRVYLWLIALGMGLGFLGDLALADRLPLGRPILAGMAAFGLGHGLYIAAMLWLVKATWAAPARPWPILGIAWAGYLLLGAAGWYWLVFQGGGGLLRWAALPYTLLLASTAGLGAGLAALHPPLAGLAVGTALFLISDLILAVHLFRGITFPLLHDLVWLTYGPAQMLIVYSVLFLPG